MVRLNWCLWYWYDDGDGEEIVVVGGGNYGSSGRVMLVASWEWLKYVAGGKIMVWENRLVYFGCKLVESSYVYDEKFI